MKTLIRRTIGATAALVTAFGLAACGDSGDDGGDGDAGGTTSSTQELSGEVVVLAAASLTETFDQLGKDFEAEHPGVEVTFSYGGSGDLATQITGGAPADVFAAANETTMKTVTDAGLTAADPEIFVRNTLEIAVPKGNPADVKGLEDFTDPDLTIALCAEDVPCGSAATKIFDAAGLTPAPDTLEEDVKATLTKVELGEVDAALVYKTDVNAAGDKVEGIDFPEAEDAVNNYPIAVLKDAPNAEAAQAFVDYVLSDKGSKVLTAAGFQEP